MRKAALRTGFGVVVTHYTKWFFFLEVYTCYQTHDDISTRVTGLTREAAWRTGIDWVVAHYFFLGGWFGGCAESDA